MSPQDVQPPGGPTASPPGNKISDISRLIPLSWLVRAGRVMGLKSMSLRTRIGTIHIRPADSDADVFQNIFAKRRPYDISPFPQYGRVVAAYRQILEAGERPLIIDAGANVGAATRWFAQEFPEAIVVAIEPDHASAEMWRRNLRNVDRAIIVEAALGSSSGRVDVLTSTTDSLGTRTVRSRTGDTDVVTIEDMQQLAGEKARLFIVKVDIEGFERDLFAESTGWVAATPVVMVEPHDWRFPGQKTSETLLRVLSKTGHELLIAGGDTLVFVR